MMHRRVGLMLCALGTAGILAGCSSSPTKSSSSTTTSTTAPAATTTSTTKGGATTTTTTKAGVTTTTAAGPATTTIPTGVPNQDAVRKNVTLKNCGASPGGWSAGGIVNNPTGSSTTYQITIFFTSAQATDLASASTSVPLGPHKSTLWSAKATFAAPSQVLCVLRGVGTS
jgi:hypothetical protein